MSPETPSFIDLTLQVVAVVMCIASITFLVLRLITVEHAVILLGVGMLAMSLERLSGKR